jgi:hypothetical protein
MNPVERALSLVEQNATLPSTGIGEDLARILATEVRRLRDELQLAGTVALDRKMRLDYLRATMAAVAQTAVTMAEDLTRAATEP